MSNVQQPTQSPVDADETDDYNDDLIDPGCAGCGGDAGPHELCEDCTDAGAHVAGPDEPCDEVEQLREQHTKLLALYNKNVGSLVDQLDAATAENDRLQTRNEQLKAGLLGAEDAIAEAEADRDRMRRTLKWEQFILWGELALHEAKLQARRGRRLKAAMHDDPAVADAWETFRDALDAAIKAEVAEGGAQ